MRKYRRTASTILVISMLTFVTSCSKKEDQSSNTPAESERVILKSPYNWADDFSCGLGFVRIGEWGFIDKTGQDIATINN